MTQRRKIRREFPGDSNSLRGKGQKQFKNVGETSSKFQNLTIPLAKMERFHVFGISLTSSLLIKDCIIVLLNVFLFCVYHASIELPKALFEIKHEISGK